MKLPIFHRTNDNKLQKAGSLDFSEVGTKHKLHADVEKVIGTIHTRWTGNPHPRYFILPKGSTTTLELKADRLISRYQNRHTGKIEEVVLTHEEGSTAYNVW